MAKCPSCGSGSYQKSGDQVVCLHCGTVLETRPPEPRAEPEPAISGNLPSSSQAIPESRTGEKRREPRHLPHYKRVSEKLPDIETALARGVGIRQAAREFGVSINTVRGIDRKSSKASQAQQARREREKEHHWLRFALRGLAVHAGRYTPAEMFAHAVALLEKYMEGNPERTVFELIPGAREGAPFDCDDLVRATVDNMVRETLNYDSETFEHIGNGTYRVKR